MSNVSESRVGCRRLQTRACLPMRSRHRPRFHTHVGHFTDSSDRSASQRLQRLKQLQVLLHRVGRGLFIDNLWPGYSIVQWSPEAARSAPA